MTPALYWRYTCLYGWIIYRHMAWDHRSVIGMWAVQSLKTMISDGSHASFLLNARRREPQGKKKYYFMRNLTSILLILFLFSSCDKNNDAIVTGIHLSVDELTLSIGEEYQYEIIHEPADAPTPQYNLNISDSEIVDLTIDGLLRAKKEGEAIFYVSTIDAFDKEGRPFSASCQVKVKPVSISNIEFDSEAFSFMVGDTIQLPYTITPENVTYKNISWISSDENIIKITPEGELVGINIGKSTIIVMSEENKNVKDTCVVDILARPLEGIELDKTEISYCGIGTSETLSVHYIPEYATNKNITWTSSDPNIATVDENGVVSIINIGTCIITATSEDGNHTATCTITVPYVKVEGIYFDNEEYEIGVGHTLQLEDETNIFPSHASNREVTYNISLGKDIISIDKNGLVTGLKEGTAIVEAKSVDGGYTTSCFVKVVEAVIANVDCSIDFSSWGNIGGYLTSQFLCTVVNNNEEPIILRSFEVIASDGEDGKTLELYKVIYPHSSTVIEGHFNSIYEPYYLLFFEYKGVCCHVKRIRDLDF